MAPLRRSIRRPLTYSSVKLQLNSLWKNRIRSLTFPSINRFNRQNFSGKQHHILYATFLSPRKTRSLRPSLQPCYDASIQKIDPSTPAYGQRPKKPSQAGPERQRQYVVRHAHGVTGRPTPHQLEQQRRRSVVGEQKAVWRPEQ